MSKELEQSQRIWEELSENKAAWVDVYLKERPEISKEEAGLIWEIQKNENEILHCKPADMSKIDKQIDDLMGKLSVARQKRIAAKNADKQSGSK
jgi:hypothetical protein